MKINGKARAFQEPQWRKAFTEFAALAQQLVLLFLISDLGNTQGQDVWQIQNPNLHAVVHAAGKFVAVGEAGAIWSSTNGTTWRKESSGTQSVLGGITYGQQTFVAVGGPNGPVNGTSVLISGDAVHWKSVSDNFISVYRSVSYGNSTFVACAASPCWNCEVTELGISSNSVSWTKNAFSKSMKSIAFGNGLFVGVGENGSTAISPDGQSWTTTSSEITEHFLGVGFANKLFLAVGENGLVATSTDGITWSRENSGTTNSLRCATGHGLKFVVGGSNGTILISTNAIRWAKIEPATDRDLNGLASAENLLVAVGDYATILTSSDGEIWEPNHLGANSYFNGIAFGTNSFVAITEDLKSGMHKISASKDGVKWSDKYSSLEESLTGVGFISTSFVALGSKGSIFVSIDGESWNRAISEATNRLNSIAGDGDVSVAVGEAGSVLLSTDGKRWSKVVSGIADDLVSVAFGGGRFVAVGKRARSTANCEDSIPLGIVITSTNGISWESRVVDPLFIPAGVGFGRNTFVISGEIMLGTVDSDAGCIFIGPTARHFASTNGAQWLPSDRSGFAENLPLTDAHYVAAGGQLYFCLDGIDWLRLDPQPPSGSGGIAYGNGAFFSVGWSIWKSSQHLRFATAAFRNDTGFFGDVLGPENANVIIQASPDFQNWTSVELIDLAGGQSQFLDTTATNLVKRFYRMVASE